MASSSQVLSQIHTSCHHWFFISHDRAEKVSWMMNVAVGSRNKKTKTQGLGRVLPEHFVIFRSLMQWQAVSVNSSFRQPRERCDVHVAFLSSLSYCRNNLFWWCGVDRKQDAGVTTLYVYKCHSTLIYCTYNHNTIKRTMLWVVM